MKKQPAAVCRTTALTVNQIAISNYCQSPIQRSNAITVLRSLRLWRQFRLNPANTALLAEQSELTTKQVEAALDFLLIAKVLRLTRRDGGVFVERVKRESEAA